MSERAGGGGRGEGSRWLRRGASPAAGGRLERGDGARPRPGDRGEAGTPGDPRLRSGACGGVSSLAARKKVSGMPVGSGVPFPSGARSRPFACSTEPGCQPAVAHRAAAFARRPVGDKAAAPPATPAPLPAARRGPGAAVLSATGVWGHTDPLNARQTYF